jgi:hypothetical protein
MNITLLIAARALIVLGVLHVVVGLVQFRVPPSSRPRSAGSRGRRRR